MAIRGGCGRTSTQHDAANVRGWIPWMTVISSHQVWLAAAALAMLRTRNDVADQSVTSAGDRYVHLGKIALAPELAACNAQISAS
jgi:hypothetical protein